MVISIIFLIATVVMMIIDYKKFYVYLLVMLGLGFQLWFFYGSMAEEAVPRIAFWLGGLIPAEVLFAMLSLRRKKGDE